MKNYAVICVVISVLSLSVVADSLRTNAFLTRVAGNPCPPDFTGNIPNPEDCHSFYICDAGVPGLIPCPAGLCFNPSPDGGACDHCAIVPGCGGASPPPTTQAPVTTTTKSPPTTENPPPETTTPPRTNPPTTPAPTTPAPTTTLRTTTSSGGGELSCPPDVPYIYLPYPGDCNKFYYCQNGENTGVYNCGAGLWFNFRQQVCAVPWGSSCEQ